MSEPAKRTSRSGDPAVETAPSKPCNHRGLGREFARDESGVSMICSGCGEKVVPASQRPLAA